MMDGYFGMNMGSFGTLMWLTWVLVLVALVLGIIWLWKQINKK
nr:hypothetical protein [uncultured archaeon]